MRTKITMLVSAVAVVAAIVAGTASSVMSPSSPTASNGIELRWGEGGAPRYVAASARDASTSSGGERAGLPSTSRLNRADESGATVLCRWPIGGWLGSMPIGYLLATALIAAEAAKRLFAGL